MIYIICNTQLLFYDIYLILLLVIPHLNIKIKSLLFFQFIFEGGVFVFYRSVKIYDVCLYSIFYAVLIY